MTTFTWTTTSGSGNWSNTANWSPVGSPGTLDTALINQIGTYGITVDTAGTVAGITLNDSNATLSFASFNENITSFVSLQAGTISISGGGLANKSSSSSLNISGGLLTESGGTASFGTGGISMSNGTVTLTGGGFNTTAALTISGGTLTDSGAGMSLTNGFNITGGTVAFNSGNVVTTGTTTQDTIAAGVLLSMGGGTITASNSGTGILNSGTIQGFGTLITGTGLNDIEGAGKIVAKGGTLSVTAAANQGFTSPSFSISDSSALAFSGPVGSTASVSFSGTTSEVLSLTAPSNNFSATVSNFFNGDTILITGAASNSLDGTGKIMTVKNAGSSTIATINFAQSQTGKISETGSTFTTTLCFAAGSRIRTEQGDVPVEQLAQGDRVAVLRDGEIGFTTITWIGERRINLATHPHPQTAAPVRVRRGAIAENLPERDLVVSPDHCLFLDGKLIPAKSLINGMTIVQERWVPAVHYFHVEVDPHAVLLAEGLPVESYLDTGNRAYFLNSGAELVLHPEFTVNAGLKAWETHACAPLTVQPEAVRPVWQRFADRALEMGFAAPQPETTAEADLHLLANGRTIRPMTAQDGRYVFAVPAGCKTVHLVSRATIPSDLAAWCDDWRSIGVAVTRMVARTQAGQMVIPADHPALAHGWHPVETDGASSWRWTDGNAELSLGALDGPAILEVHVGSTPRYIVEAEQQEQQRLVA